MAKSKEKYSKIFNIIADLAIIVGILLLLVTYDNFAHGSAYLFVAITGLITALLGIVSGVCRYYYKKWFSFFTNWFSIVGLFLIFSFWLVDKQIIYNPAFVFFGLFWVFNIVFLYVVRTNNRFKILALIKKNIELLTLFTAIIIAVWLIPLENMFSLVQSPNQAGTQSYVGRDYSLDITGGFLYRINYATPTQPEEVIIKQIAPITKVRFNNQQANNIRLNFLNTPQNHLLTVNGSVVGTQPYLYGERLTMDINNNVKVNSEAVYSKEYTGTRKGYWADIKFKTGESEISISPQNDQGSLHFYVVSDLHSGYSVNFEELQKIIKDNPDFIIFNGDIVNYGAKPEYVVAGGLMEMSPVPIYTTIGNHEDWQHGAKFYRDYFGPLTSSFTYKGCLFVFLDTHTGYIGQTQFDWLSLTLASSGAKHKYVFTHIPPIDPVIQKFDDKTYRYEEMRSNIFDKSESDKLISILNDFGAEVMFAGHTHSGGRYNIGGTLLVTSGAFGGTVSRGDDVSYLNVFSDSETKIDKVDVLNLDQVAGNEFNNKVHMLQIFAGPFLLDKAIRLNLSIVLLVLAGYLIRKKAVK